MGKNELIELHREYNEKADELSYEYTEKIIKKLYSNLHRDIKRKFGVSSYKDIKVVEYEKALNFIENWIEDAI